MIGNILASPAIYEFSKTAQAQVGVATGLKAIGRPGFIILDNNIDPQTKKYSAMKEFLYQLTCLGMAMFVVSNFKKYSPSIGRLLFKNEQVFKAFKDYGEFSKYLSLDNAGKIAKLAQLDKIAAEAAQKAGKIHETFEIGKINESLAIGMKEISSIVGSMIGLSIAAPLISRPLIRPVLKALGLGKKEDQVSDKTPSKVIANA